MSPIFPSDVKPHISAIRKFLHHEAAGGICLMIAAVCALLVANTPIYHGYQHLLNTYFQIGFENASGTVFETFAVRKPIVLWINDGMMAIFFLLVGLEIKREFIKGELSSRDRAMLPIIGAIGGVVAPALIFYAINMDHPENMAGWAIPAATDIAFALGILGILGRRVPVTLKVLLTAVAIIDDLMAIVIIALFYTSNLTLTALGVAAVGIVIMAIMNRRGVKNIGPYVIVGLFMWAAVLKSGVHATLAGVIMAMFIPIKGKTDNDPSPLLKMEHSLHPWVAFMVLPIFGFANAGINFANIEMYHVIHPLTIGIAAGLFFGKQIGIFLFSVIAIKLDIANKPKGSTWLQIYGVSLLAGIGFTMSLFIGKLAFDTQDAINEIRLGVMGGSLVSGVLGFAILYWAGRNRLSDDVPERPDLGQSLDVKV